MSPSGEKKLLIANRGEIACRVMRTAKAMGWKVAAVYSEADQDAPHVLMADDARCLGPAAASESYLDTKKVLDAAKAMGCTAVHPGYGFLSENTDFAAACAKAGISFVGPGAEAVRLMGDKAQARSVAESADVSPVPGFQGSDDEATLVQEAQRIGFPLLVKAAKGGGGKGMRLVREAKDLESGIKAARREAQNAFGDGALLLERYVHPSRHIEVQILADEHGNTRAVLERECSLQRRHQKVVEECPSPVVGQALRAKLSAAAVKLAQAVNYVGAGTVEFLLAEDESFYFLEMNTRLQVEHGVTELATGEDLVAWQLRIVDGEKLTLSEDVQPSGHALEVRIYAEDPAAGYLPQAGKIEALRWPSGPGIRVDAGVREGQEVTPHYDPMLAKIMAHGHDRAHATKRLVQALKDTVILGPATNIGWLIGVLEAPEFHAGQTFTHSLEAGEITLPAAQATPKAAWLFAACGLEHSGTAGSQLAHGGGSSDADAWSPWRSLPGFRLTGKGGAS